MTLASWTQRRPDSTRETYLDEDMELHPMPEHGGNMPLNSAWIPIGWLGTHTVMMPNYNVDFYDCDDRFVEYRTINLSYFQLETYGILSYGGVDEIH